MALPNFFTCPYTKPEQATRTLMVAFDGEPVEIQLEALDAIELAVFQEDTAARIIKHIPAHKRPEFQTQNNVEPVPLPAIMNFRAFEPTANMISGACLVLRCWKNCPIREEEQFIQIMAMQVKFPAQFARILGACSELMETMETLSSPEDEEGKKDSPTPI